MKRTYLKINGIFLFFCLELKTLIFYDFNSMRILPNDITYGDVQIDYPLITAIL